MIKKIIPRVLVFIAVAVFTAFFVNKLNNSNLKNVSRELEEPTQPIIYMSVGGVLVNPIYGYSQVMNTGLMRDSIVPLDSEGGVTFLLNEEDNDGSTFSYELRNINGDNLIEQGEATGTGNGNGYQEFHIKFRMDMRDNQEYAVVFIKNDKDTKVRYYTRVVKLNTNYANDIIKFSRNFHDVTFDKDVNETDGNIVYDHLKTTGEGTNGDLSHVNLNSSYNMVSWGGMNPMVITGVIPTIKEIDNDSAIINMSYIVQTVNDSGDHFYTVEEFYDAKYDKYTDSIELLSFDRYQKSFFDEKYINKDKNSLCMGIDDTQNLYYVTSSDNKKIAFVKAGQLWLYDYPSASVVSVFNFTRGYYTDARSVNDSVDINIINMDDDGNMDFVVYGYMNRGKHEGKNGFSVYKYIAGEYKIEELLFVESDEPFEVMREDIGRFTYCDEDSFYYLMGGAIYRIDMDTMEQQILVSGIPSGKYKVSENRKIVAYPNSSRDEEVTGIIIHNFETGEEYTRTGTATERFEAQGFVGNDLIYGVCDERDITIAADGSAILPYKKLYIVEPGGETIKEYSKAGIYIMDAQVLEDKIYLLRAYKQNNFFEECEPDFISYKADTGNDKVTITSNFSDSEYNQVLITLPSDMYISSSVSQIITKNKENDRYKELSVKCQMSENSYYVFDNSGYYGEYQSAGKAITEANNISSGIVVDYKGNTIYKTTDYSGYNTVADHIREVPCAPDSNSLLVCSYMCVTYDGYQVDIADVMSCSSWEEVFDKYTYGVGINISGIDLDTALYFLDRDVPFAAKIDDGRFVLVISYNSTHIRYYDPIAGEEVKVTKKAFRESLSIHGNTMYTYTSQ